MCPLHSSTTAAAVLEMLCVASLQWLRAGLHDEDVRPNQSPFHILGFPKSLFKGNSNIAKLLSNLQPQQTAVTLCLALMLLYKAQVALSQQTAAVMMSSLLDKVWRLLQCCQSFISM